MTTVVVAGALANKAGSGGEAWVRMSWVRGLQRLGLDVRFVEELAGERARPRCASSWFSDVVGALRPRRPGHPAARRRGGRRPAAGRSSRQSRPRRPSSTSAAISARLTCSSAFRRRVMVDIDPGFTQFWHRRGSPGANVEGHDLYFTIGELIGTPDCSIPTGGIEWRAVRPPVVLDDWPRCRRRARPLHDDRDLARRRSGRSSTPDGRTASRCTSSASSSSCHGGRRAPFEIALDIHPDDDADLERAACARLADRRPASGRGRPGRVSRATSRGRAPSSRSRRASTSRPGAAGSATGRPATWPRGARRWSRTPGSARPFRWARV